mgnify:CR=1 FL=1
MDNKFLSIPVYFEDKGTKVSLGNQLILANSIKTIKKGSDSKVEVKYGNGRVITITLVGTDSNFVMRDAIQDAVVAILQTTWKNVVVQLDNLPFGVTAVAIA